MGEIAQLITAVATVVAALASFGGFIVSVRNGHKIKEVHTATNSKMDRLLEVTGASEHAKGVIEGEGGRGPLPGVPR